MKKFGLILAGCLAFIGICGAHAEDIGDAARAAVRRASTSTAVADRQKTTTISSRNNTTAAHTSPTVRTRNATTTSVRNANNVVERSTNTPARTNLNVILRATNPTQTRNATNLAQVTSRTTPNMESNSNQQLRTISRATSTAEEAATREEILSRDYSKCKTVFFDCMDEFCANKDSQLKRCACSSRIHEFDSVKKRLEKTEDKMLDFSQRLLTVSMDKEDVAALSVSTEGEDAYLGTKDNSKSKKTLDAIAKKLNTSFSSSNFDSNLNTLSWSLNMDTAFDNVDSLMGIPTTAKSGTDLFAAALPVCREMAAEVCNETDVKLAESGYAAVIEQDCNAVAKTYQAQVDQAREKVLEGNALLDMSRLDAYQKRNSDDMLTCKRKMLEMLTNSTVCGTGLGKCLDVTGQYIDPSTGEAFLTPNLVNLTTLLTRPTDSYTWSTVPENSAFVSFLNSKRKFLEPAMEQCQDISTNVWNSFIDDALSQIKLAQNKKLNEVRQSCTELTAQCLTDATESITNFDARALSTFGISADITTKAMCENVLKSCDVLLAQDEINTTNPEEWTTGITGIMTTNSYETMIQTCREIGKACIIQVCSSTSGNFGLCESISNSTNRKAIINHTSCFDEVKACIESAGTDQIETFINIAFQDYTSSQISAEGLNPQGKKINFYSKMYTNYNKDHITFSAYNNYTDICIAGDPDLTIQQESDCVFDLCDDECNGFESNLLKCRVCRLAENLWGNCEADPTTNLGQRGSHNKIKVPVDTDNPTLLYWFAQNTGTLDDNDNCRDTTCGIGYLPRTNQNGLVECVATQQ